MNYYLFHNASCLVDVYSFQASFKFHAKFHAGYCIHASQNRTVFEHLENDTVPNCEQVK